MTGTTKKSGRTRKPAGAVGARAETDRVLGIPQDARTLKRLGKALDAAFTHDEITAMLARTLTSIDGPTLTQVFNRLGGDRAIVLLEVLQATTAGSVTPRSHGRSATKAKPSSAKLRQEWTKIWSEWDDLVDGTQTLSGQFVHQEKDWEPPYVDLSELSDELDRVAGDAREQSDASAKTKSKKKTVIKRKAPAKSRVKAS